MEFPVGRFRHHPHASRRGAGVVLENTGRGGRRQAGGDPREEHADVPTSYDYNGGDGQPDHIQVHRVGLRAARLAGHPASLPEHDESGSDRRGWPPVRRTGERGGHRHARCGDQADFGKPEREIIAAVDVSPVPALEAAGDAGAREPDQPASFFLAMPDEAVSYAFGIERFIRAARSPASPRPTCWPALNRPPAREPRGPPGRSPCGSHVSTGSLLCTSQATQNPPSIFAAPRRQRPLAAAHAVGRGNRRAVARLRGPCCPRRCPGSDRP